MAKKKVRASRRCANSPVTLNVNVNVSVYLNGEAVSETVTTVDSAEIAPVAPPREPLRGKTHKQYSSALGRTMRYRVYGDRGLPLVAFPTSEAHYTQWEEFGMTEALRDLIDEGAIQIWTVDTIDAETFFPPVDEYLLVGTAMERYQRYLDYLRDEFFPHLMATTGQAPILTGCSMGAYHAANYFFRYPEKIAGVIALSGVYTLSHFLGSTSASAVAENSPLEYLRDLNDHPRNQYLGRKLIFCAGQGPNEQEMLIDTRALGELLAAREIPAWVDIWGEESAHDWPWWFAQMKYFLGKVLGAQS